MAEPTSRAASLATLAVGLGALVGLSVVLVPWAPSPEPAATSEFFTAAEVARGDAYAVANRWLFLAGLTCSVGTALWWAWSSRGRAVAERWGARRWGWCAVVATIVVSGELLTVPWAVWRHHRALTYEVTDQSWASWGRDLTVSSLVDVAVTGLIVGVVILARRWRTWPTIAAALLGALVVGGSAAYPLVVEPLFVSATPLADQALTARIADIAERQGIVVDEVVVVDASRRTRTYNAYVSGIGPTQRIVVYDTLLQNRPQAEVLSVVAHELSHARHRDVWRGTALGVTAVVAICGLGGLVLRDRSSPQGIVAATLVAWLAVGMIVSAPLVGAVSRQWEARADRDALASYSDRYAYACWHRASALRASSDVSPPRGWQLWWGTHPTTMQRLSAASGEDVFDCVSKPLERVVQR